MNNNYTEIKNIFVEGSDKVDDFVNLDKSTLAYHKILNALQKPLKLILFYGKPGCGKTFLLHKIRGDLVKKAVVVFMPQPFFDEAEFFHEIFVQIFGRTPKQPVKNYENFMRIYKEISRLFRFLFTVHKTDEEDTLAKDYFKTRIWESIELPNSTLSELRLYIEKKLVFHDFHPYFMMYSEDNFNLLFHLTDGNLRNLNKLLYKMYEILEYYETNRPTEIGSSCINSKIIEMAAISAGLINA